MKVPDIYPVTIVQARYGGVYEGGAWIAFHMDPTHDIIATGDWDGGDNECDEWWQHHGVQQWVAVGPTPEAALAALAHKLHPERFSPVRDCSECGAFYTWDNHDTGD